MPTSTGPGGAIASFNNQMFIDPNKHLPQLDQGPVRAYAASGASDVSQVTHFAMVCEPDLVPRSRAAAAYATISNTALIKLVATGPIYWPPAQGERYVFIYEMPVGRPLMKEGQFTGLGIKPDVVLTALVRPICYALMDLHDADIAHGNIRPSTIYGVGSGTFERTVLSECLSFPMSFNQPVMFEPIERAMAMPLGRGPARIENDIYALGVSMAFALRTRDPMEGMSDDEIIKHKIEIGSLAALTSKDRISGNVIELLRGLLQDDRALRWTLDDIVMWLDGQHVAQKQSSKKPKAARPITFENERYLRPPLLAMDLNKSQSEAAQLIETKGLEQWVGRSLEDSAIMKRLESAIESVEEHGHGPGYWDRLLCRVSVALDPDAPIRYKGVTVFPEAIGNCVVSALIKRTDVQPYIDIINQQTATFWATAQPDTQVDLRMIVNLFDSCRAFLKQNNVAYGIERCAYFLNPACPCLSEKLKGFYVQTPEDMLRAFEKISTQPNRPQLMLDRHTIGFLSVKERKCVDFFLIELNAQENYRKIMGNLKVLATIQQRFRMEKMPGICRWFSEILDPVYERFHDREMRISIKKHIDQLVSAGDITKIAALLDNQQNIARDNDAYNAARAEYNDLRTEGAQLSKRLADPSLFGRSAGREAAAVVSCVISGFAILFFIFTVFSKGSIF